MFQSNSNQPHPLKKNPTPQNIHNQLIKLLKTTYPSKIITISNSKPSKITPTQINRIYVPTTTQPISKSTK